MTQAAENVILLNWLEANQAALIALVAGGMPIGTVIDFGGSVVPASYLPCDGAAVSRTTYAALFAALGVLWGVGDGSTTFNLPDLRRRTTVNAGGTGTGTLGNVVGNVGGAETHTLTLAQLASHNHAGSVTGAGGAHAHTVDGSAINGANGTGGVGAVFAPGVFTSAVPDHTHSVTPASNGSDQAHNNIQPSAIVLKCIRAL